MYSCGETKEKRLEDLSNLMGENPCATNGDYQVKHILSVILTTVYRAGLFYSIPVLWHNTIQLHGWLLHSRFNIMLYKVRAIAMILKIEFSGEEDPRDFMISFASYASVLFFMALGN